MKKICILTFHRAINYGALLQAYALQCKIKEFDIECDILDYDNLYFNEFYATSWLQKGISTKKRIKLVYHLFRHPIKHRKARKKYKKLVRFMKNNLKLSDYCISENIKDVIKNYEGVVVGSDQVWNISLSNYDSTYLLDFLDDDSNVKRLSYAASLGKSYITGYEYDLMKKNLPKFNKLLIRENEGCSIVKNNFKLKCNNVLDPTLLHTKEFWHSKAKAPKEKNYILVYFVQSSNYIGKIIEDLSEKENLEIISLSELNINKKYKYIGDAGIEEFLGLIEYAKYVFVTSFHGFVFSIIFHKNFYYELSKKIPNNNSRMIDIAKVLNLSDREITSSEISLKPINYEYVDEKLSSLRNQSISLLKEELEDTENE